MARKWVVLRFLPGQGNLKDISGSLGGLTAVLVNRPIPVSQSVRACLFSFFGSLEDGLRRKSDRLLALILISPTHPSSYSLDGAFFIRKLSCVSRKPTSHPTSLLHSVGVLCLLQMPSDTPPAGKKDTSWQLSYPTLRFSAMDLSFLD